MGEKFHDIVDQQIQLNMKWKSNDDIEQVLDNFTNIQTSKWS